MYSTTELEYPPTAADKEQDVENPLSMLVRHVPHSFVSNMSKFQFHRFIQKNSDFKVERDKHGTVTIHPPMSLNSGYYEEQVVFFLKLWSMSHKALGKVYSPSTAFDLPDGSTYRADGAWISVEKLAQLTEEEKNHIAAIVPDFVMEVRSQTDSIQKMKRKMTEVWMDNGVRLAWLIDPIRQKAWVYRQNGAHEEVANFSGTLSGEGVLPGFELKLRDLLEN